MGRREGSSLCWVARWRYHSFNSMTSPLIWAPMREKRPFRDVRLTQTQSSLHIRAVWSMHTVNILIRLRETQADLNFHWALMFEGTFSDVAAGFHEYCDYRYRANTVPSCLQNVNFLVIENPSYRIHHGKTCLNNRRATTQSDVLAVLYLLNTASWPRENALMSLANWEDSDQHMHPRHLIKIFFVDVINTIRCATTRKDPFATCGQRRPRSACAYWSGPALSAYRIIRYYSICRRTENVQTRLNRCACWSWPTL